MTHDENLTDDELLPPFQPLMPCQTEHSRLNSTMNQHVWTISSYFDAKRVQKTHFYIFGGKLKKEHGCEALWSFP